jgi:hypothetical protein
MKEKKQMRLSEDAHHKLRYLSAISRPHQTMEQIMEQLIDQRYEHCGQGDMQREISKKATPVLSE